MCRLRPVTPMLAIPKVIASSQNADVRSASFAVQCTSSLTAIPCRAIFFGVAMISRRGGPMDSPSGRNPRSSGDFLTTSKAGATPSTIAAMPKTVHVWRHPNNRISPAPTTGMQTLAKPIPMLAIASMGIGFAKVCMPVVGAGLILLLGWRHTWTVFGIAAIVLGVAPALLVVRKSPEDLGLRPDGDSIGPPRRDIMATPKKIARHGIAVKDDVHWTAKEALRTSAFWLLAITFGIASIGVTGLNLHIYSYVTDLGYSAVAAASVMSVIASMQLASPLAWGFLLSLIHISEP